MGKHLDKVGMFEDFRAPWETEAGETEIDKDRLKKYVFGLVTDKAKAQDARDDAEAAKTQAETERDEVKAAAEKGADPDLAKQLEDERAKTAEATARAEKAERGLLVSEVAIDKKLTPAQAKRLVGNTKEELEADADELLESFGGNGSNEEDGEDGGDANLVRTPRAPYSNPAGSQQAGGTPSKQPDYEQVALERRSNRVFG